MKFRYTGKNTFDIVAECSWENLILELLQISLTARNYDTYKFNHTMSVRCNSEDNQHQFVDLLEDFADELQQEVKEWRDYRNHYAVWDKEGELCV